ncbi:MAG: hypothetical protein ABIE70_00550 [bacterium]
MKRTMTVSLAVLLCGLVITLTAVEVLAANPATISVTVTIQSLSVTATGPLAFGTVLASSETVSTDSSHVVNAGNVAETYAIKLTNPGGWTATSGAPGSETYRLSAQFNATKPTAVSFDADTYLTTSDQTSSATIFAGDQTGLAVAASAARYLWIKFEAPTSTTVTTEQDITVTITASAA